MHFGQGGGNRQAQLIQPDLVDEHDAVAVRPLALELGQAVDLAFQRLGQGQGVGLFLEHGLHVGRAALDQVGQLQEQAGVGGVVGVAGGVDQDVRDVASGKAGGLQLVPVGPDDFPGDVHASHLLHFVDPLHLIHMLGQRMGDEHGRQLHGLLVSHGEAHAGQQHHGSQYQGNNALHRCVPPCSIFDATQHHLSIILPYFTGKAMSVHAKA